VKRKILLLTCLAIAVLIFIRERPFVERKKEAVDLTQPPAEILPRPYVWKKIGHGISEIEVTRIAIAPDSANALLVSTPRAVYRSHGASGYLASLYLEGSKRVVYDLYVDQQAQASYAATDFGLYQSVDAGGSWKRIYLSEKGKEEECLSVLALGTTIFLGTTRGLFVLDRDEKRWRLLQSSFQDKPIFHLAGDERYVYASSANEVYRMTPLGRDVRKIFSAVSQHGSAEDREEEEGVSETIQDIQASRMGQSPKIWLISERGIFISNDRGDSWQRLAQDGISLEDITSAAACQDMLYLASTKGAYRFVQNVWQSLYAGAETQRFAQVVCSPDNRVYAATDKGVFELTSPTGVDQATEIAHQHFQEFLMKEPSIQLVHKMAIAYAEVSPEKIKQWRRQLAKKALLPSLSIGVDGDRNKTTSDNVYGSYASGGQSYIGPDDKTFYNNLGWDVSLSWDLGDLVWNPDETSVDNRSKLMVELREDILNEATRLYFERRRLQMQMMQTPDGEARAGLEMQMRIDELTALIDALTGGEFSRSLGEHGSGGMHDKL